MIKIKKKNNYDNLEKRYFLGIKKAMLKRKKKKKVYEELIFCQSFLVHGQSKTTKGLYILID